MTATSAEAAAEATPVTRLLLEWRAGDAEALNRLMPLVFEDLRTVARRRMVSEGPVTLQPTALVHEAYLRLVGLDIKWQGRVHFFAIAASLMRRILVDEARRRQAKKRGGGESKLPLEEADGAVETAPELVALDDALQDLERMDARKARVVELYFFAGLTIKETARALEIGHSTVERDLKMARAWIARHMQSSGDQGPGESDGTDV
ncbi:MAG: sigma-70 family RNA polymerase sigma factor [Acidobacteriota bacterium]